MRKIPYCCATALFLAALFLTGLGASAQELDTAVLNFQVIRDYNGKPIRNASVVMHPVEKNGKQGKGGLQIKTDADGKASYEGAPYGKLRIQVLAGGFQTFGADYDIDKPALDITVKMKRPAGQYSIYEEHPEDKKPDTPDSAPDSKDKPK
jgi:hypothetical protein